VKFGWMKNEGGVTTLKGKPTKNVVREVVKGEVEQDCTAEILRTKFNWTVSCK